MAITIDPYDHFKATMMGGEASGGIPVDYLTDTIKVALVGDTHVPALTTDEFYSDLDNEVANGNGYTTGGEPLASRTLVVAAGEATYDAEDVVWTFTTTTAFEYAVVYKDTGVAGTSPLMWLVTFDPVRSEDGEFTLRWHADGIWTIA